jgi:sulfur-oxidizing protein SoxY
MPELSRRQALAGSVAVAAAMLVRPARATPADAEAAMAEVLKGRTARKGRVKLDIPRLAESGLNVSLDVSVESPMTPADYVKAVYLFAPQNPLPNIARYHFTPASGRAAVTTRVRLADTQDVIALAEMSDGTFWRDEAEVVITIMACGLEPV